MCALKDRIIADMIDKLVMRKALVDPEEHGPRLHSGEDPSLPEVCSNEQSARLLLRASSSFYGPGNSRLDVRV